MQNTPLANRTAIAFFGRRNAGKSSLVNLLAGQEVSLISNVPGSTADPVKKTMELLPLGPITLIDTAGLDDEGALGAQKIRRSQKVLNEADVVILVCDGTNPDRSWELDWLAKMPDLQERLLVVENKIDVPEYVEKQWLPAKIPLLKMSALTGLGQDELKKAIVKIAQGQKEEESLIASLFPPKSLFMLVMPQDPQAPKGRLILPQVQILRDIFDHHSLALCASVNELDEELAALKRQPDLVIVDSQVFRQVAEKIPKLPLTSFSIIMARAKGDFKSLVEGARSIDQLKPPSRILIAEACTHHALKNDIARDFIPGLLRKKIGAGLTFDVLAGYDFVKDAEEAKKYDLIISCGGCMLTRKQYLARQTIAQKAQVPMTNFGLILAKLSGILERATEIF